MPSSYIFALTSMSFRYLPLFYDMIGGLLRIVFIRGWFSIRLEFAIHVFLRSCSAGWYVLTKGNSLYSLFCFCLGADCLSQRRPLTTTFLFLRIPACFETLFKVRKALIKCRFWRICSKQSYCFAVNESSFYPQRVTWGKVCMLKGFSQLIAGFDVQDGFHCESLSSENCSIKES